MQGVLPDGLFDVMFRQLAFGILFMGFTLSLYRLLLYMVVEQRQPRPLGTVCLIIAICLQLNYLDQHVFIQYIFFTILYIALFSLQQLLKQNYERYYIMIFVFVVSMLTRVVHHFYKIGMIFTPTVILGAVTSLCIITDIVIRGIVHLNVVETDEELELVNSSDEYDFVIQDGPDDFNEAIDHIDPEELDDD